MRDIHNLTTSEITTSTSANQPTPVPATPAQPRRRGNVFSHGTYSAGADMRPDPKDFPAQNLG